MEIKCIKDKIFDEERALYHLTDTKVYNCTFAGPRDGESALKEARNIEVRGCFFSLRYPFWHTKNFVLAIFKLPTLVPSNTDTVLSKEILLFFQCWFDLH